MIEAMDRRGRDRLRALYLHELGPIMSAAKFVQELHLGRSALRPSSRLPFASRAEFVAFGHQDRLHGKPFFYLRGEGLGGNQREGIYIPSLAADDLPVRPFRSALNTDERRKPLLERQR